MARRYRNVFGVVEVQENIAYWKQQRIVKLRRAVELEIIPLLESYAKAHAPWQDRTGNARRGLHADYMIWAEGLRIWLAHAVHYGKFLELGRAGRYAILQPTMRACAQRIRGILSEYFAAD